MTEKMDNPHDDETGATRRCVVCKADVPRDLALRFVADPEGWAVWDPARRAPGRGFSVCAMSACVTKMRTDLPGVKALGARISGTLTVQMMPTLQRDVLEKLGLLWRQRKLVVGVEPIIEALKRGDRLSGAIVATDASERSRENLQRELDTRVILLPASMDTLGQALGRDVVAAAGWRDDSVTSSMGLFGRVKLWSDLAARSASFEQGQGQAHG